MTSRDRALDDLQFIRDTMERSTPLTCVSGIGLVLMGVTAVATSYVAALNYSVEWYLNVWTVEAMLGCSIGFGAMWVKARRSRASVFSGAGKRFVLSLGPPIIAGVLLSEAIYLGDHLHLMPGTWLTLYGVGIVTGGAFSIRPIPVMGVAFMVLGALSLFLPEGSFDVAWGIMTTQDLLLATGFGGLHIVFGGLIVARYGG